MTIIDEQHVTTDEDLERLPDLLGRMRHALQWASAAPAFQPGGEAREGWEKIVQPLLDETYPQIIENAYPSQVVGGVARFDAALVDVAPGESAVVQIVDPAPGQNRVVVHRQERELGHEPDGREFTSSVCRRCGLMVAYAVRDQVVCGGMAGKSR